MSEGKPDLIDFMIRHAWHRIARMYNQMAVKEGITTSAGFILMMVEKNGTPSTQLGPKMGMEPTSLSRTLNAMEKDGLIYRSDCVDDRRKALVHLTEAGIQKRKLIRKFILTFNDDVTAKLKKRDLEGFHKVMSVLDNLLDDVVEDKK